VQEHTQIGHTIGAGVFNDHDRPPRRFAPGRVCAHYDCGTRLSIYNKGSYCAIHAKSVVRTRGKKLA
jgi:hypothetical protein